ncbi:MAG: hypothetical protein H0X35_10840 [Pseudonocardiales bacterium]|nr:hypothetical protein [Pseudonocardiales bacterium]
MPDQGDPFWGAEERFAEAVDLGRPSSRPVDADLARDLEIAEMFRALGPSLSAASDAKARVRARVMAAMAVDGPPSNGGGRAPEARLAAPEPVGPERTAPDSPTEQLPVIPPVEAEPLEDTPATTRLGVTTLADEAGPSTAVLTEPDVVRALRPGRRRRHALPSRPSARPTAGAPSIRRRLMSVGAAALLTVIAIAGGGVFASRGSLPGDPLYAIKRATEAASGIFAGGDASRARRDLNLAATRLDEIQAMVRESADAGLISSALQDFNVATSEGSRLVLSGNDSENTYADLVSWSTQQSARLSQLRSALPASTQPAGADSLRLLDRVHRRATALSARSSCSQVTSGAADDLGPLPATGPCARQSAPGGSAPAADPTAVRRASSTPEPGTRSSTPQQNLPSGSGGAPRANDGTSPDDESGSVTTTTPAPATSTDVDVPLPLPVPPINVPPLLPGKPRITLG